MGFVGDMPPDRQLSPRSGQHDLVRPRLVVPAAMKCGAMTIVFSSAPARNAAPVDVSK